MSSQFQSNNPTSYFGVFPTNPGNNFFHDRDPDDALDIHNYRPGDRWINKTLGTIWGLIDIVNQASPLPPVARWVLLGSLAKPEIETLTGDDSVAIAPTAGNVDIVGNSTQGISTSKSATSTMTITAADASTSSKGVAKFDSTYFSTTSGNVSLKGPLPLAIGGTNNATYTTTNGILKYNGTELVDSSATIDASGRYQNALQPMFIASAAVQSNVTGDSTPYTVQFTTVSKNVGGGFDGVSTFTAPVAGTYLFLGIVRLDGLISSHIDMDLNIGSEDIYTLDPYSMSSGTGVCRVNASNILYLNASDTVTVSVTVYSGTKVVGIGTGSYFKGFLLS